MCMHCEFLQCVHALFDTRTFLVPHTYFCHTKHIRIFPLDHLLTLGEKLCVSENRKLSSWLWLIVRIVSWPLIWGLWWGKIVLTTAGRWVNLLVWGNCWPQPWELVILMMHSWENQRNCVNNWHQKRKGLGIQFLMAVYHFTYYWDYRLLHVQCIWRKNYFLKFHIVAW